MRMRDDFIMLRTKLQRWELRRVVIIIFVSVAVILLWSFVRQWNLWFIWWILFQFFLFLEAIIDVMRHEFVFESRLMCDIIIINADVIITAANAAMILLIVVNRIHINSNGKNPLEIICYDQFIRGIHLFRGKWAIHLYSTLVCGRASTRKHVLEGIISHAFLIQRSANAFLQWMSFT